MNRRMFFAFFVRGALSAAAIGTALTHAESARADGVDDVLADIKKARAGIKTLTGTFSQERTIGLLATAVKSEGELTLVAPNQLRWELKPPDAITYWITPEGFAFATPKGGGGVGKGAAGRFGAVLSDMLLLLGGDLSKLRARYTLSVPSRKDGLIMVFEPKAEEVKKYVKRIEMRAGPELWTVRRIEIEEVNGDMSVITFNTIERDKPVDPAKMKPPKQEG